MEAVTRFRSSQYWWFLARANTELRLNRFNQINITTVFTIPLRNRFKNEKNIVSVK